MVPVLIFTLIFSILSGYIFWGTWSPSIFPIMPDCGTMHPYGYWNALSEYFTSTCLNTFQFSPDNLMLLIGTPYFRQELQYVIYVYAAALGFAYFLRGRGLSNLASYGAALLLSFAGYWFTLFSAGHLGWFQWMAYGVWAFGLTDRAVAGGKWKHYLLLAAVLAWGSRYQPDLWLLFSVFTFAYFVWCHFREKCRPAWVKIVVAGLVFFAVGAPSFYHAIFTDLASRDKQIENGETLSTSTSTSASENRWIFVTNWSLPPEDTLEFFWPRVHGDTSCPLTLSIGRQMKTGVTPYTGRLGRAKDAPSGNYRQHSLYLGFITCILAVIGLAGRITKYELRITNDGRDVYFFAIAGFIFYLFALGRFCEPIYRLVYMLPFGDYLRAPVKWYHLTEFAICVLAGYGIDYLQNLGARYELRITNGGIFVLILMGAINLAWVDKHYVAPVDITTAYNRKMDMQMSVVSTQQLKSPQLQSALREKYVIPMAYYLGNPDAVLVQVLKPREDARRGLKSTPVITAERMLGLISLLAGLFIIGFAVFPCLTTKR